MFDFLNALHTDIYQLVWKQRCHKFKEWKIRHNITRRTLSNCKRKRQDGELPSLNQPRTHRNCAHNIGYNNPFNNFRNLHTDDSLFIRFTSSNFRLGTYGGVKNC